MSDRHDSDQDQLEAARKRIAELEAENAELLRRWQEEELDDDWGNEYAAVCTFKNERDEARAELKEYKKKVEAAVGVRQPGETATMAIRRIHDACLAWMIRNGGAEAELAEAVERGIRIGLIAAADVARRRTGGFSCCVTGASDDPEMAIRDDDGPWVLNSGTAKAILALDAEVPDLARYAEKGEG